MNPSSLAIAATLLLGAWMTPAQAQMSYFAQAQPPRVTENIPPAAASEPRLGWVNVCRDRPVLHMGPGGRVIQSHVSMCNVVWVGRRYFNNGNYYADPNFTTRLY